MCQYTVSRDFYRSLPCFCIASDEKLVCVRREGGSGGKGEGRGRREGRVNFHVTTEPALTLDGAVVFCF